MIEQYSNLKRNNRMQALYIDKAKTVWFLSDEGYFTVFQSRLATRPVGMRTAIDIRKLKLV